MIFYTLIVVGFFGLVILLINYLGDSGNSDKVINVRETAERRIENFTVDQLHEEAQNFLMEEDFNLEKAEDNGDYLAKRSDEKRLIKIDPAAELNDPREMNRLILSLRKSSADSGILFTTRSINGQSRSLADKASIRIVEPKELLDSHDKDNEN